MPLVYDELRRLAARYIGRERPGQTLQATALVNEAFVRLVNEKARGFQNRAHFIAIAALSMRQILVQRARMRKAATRGGAPQRVTLDEAVLSNVGAGSSRPEEIDVLALDEALTRLGAIDPTQAKIVELRYFGGLTIEETAEALHSSPATVKREWAMARAWLKQELGPAPSDAGKGGGVEGPAPSDAGKRGGVEGSAPSDAGKGGGVEG
jgi:RNA polymerase sigma-70 factor (ECF subfamily)